jgi:hypothetical protein
MPARPGGVRKAITLGILLVLLGVLGRVAWLRWGQLGAPQAKLEGAYRSEEQWIAGEIVRDIVEMTAFAAAPGRPPSDSIDFSIEALPPGGATAGVRVAFSPAGRRRMEHAVEWRRHIWAPEDYQDLARAVLAALGQRAATTTGDADEDLLTALLNPRARVIETQSQRVSDRLKRSMLDPEAHEEAALVVGALGLREAAGYFWDVRQLLCRMTAHLALASALRDGAPPGLDGRYAAVILSVLSGRTAEAMAALDAIQQSAGSSETQAAWLRALRLNLTADWRALGDPGSRTLLERLEYFGAVTSTQDSAAAFHFLETHEPEPVPDWGRRALQGDFGTEIRRFATVEPEVEEAREIWARVSGRPLSSDLNRELNRPAERCITADGPRVLGWGTWAASLQRHICNRILQTDSFLRHILGQPDQAQGALADADRRWGELVLYPFVQGMRWHHGGIELESFADGVTGAVRTAASRPELANANVWTSMLRTVRYAVTRRRMPDPRSWFAYPVPSGTAYDASRRLDVLGFGQGGVTLAMLYERGPWSYHIARRTVLERFGKKPTPAQIREVFGPRADYYGGLLSWRAEVAEPRSAERQQALEEKCRMLADRCIGLARHLVALGRDDDGARALRRAFDSAYDRVEVSHATPFLVRYYHDRNRADEATRVAEDAAETGSGSGLHTMGLLLEWRGKLAEAEDYFTRIERVYDDPDSLVAFYYRMAQQGRADYQAKFDRSIRETFPAGLEKLDPARLPATPKDGVLLTNPGLDADLLGLMDGDIVVALDGWRVHNAGQYNMVWMFDLNPDVRLHLWRKGRYEDVAVKSMNRSLPLDLRTYPTTPPP